mgnify:CR=1 FL=1
MAKKNTKDSKTTTAKEKLPARKIGPREMLQLAKGLAQVQMIKEYGSM